MMRNQRERNIDARGYQPKKLGNLIFPVVLSIFNTVKLPKNWEFTEIVNSKRQDDKCPQTTKQMLEIWAMDSKLDRKMQAIDQNKNERQVK